LGAAPRAEDALELVVPEVVELVMGLIGEAMEFSCRSLSTAREVAFEFLNPLGTIGLVVVTLAALLLRPARLRLRVGVPGIGRSGVRLTGGLGAAHHSRRAPSLRAIAALIEAVHQLRQPLAEAMRQVGIAGPDRDV
jgi:hypothetical protein